MLHDLDNLKLELKSTKQVGRLELVKARAAIRTKRRIAEQLEKQELKALEEKVAADASKQNAQQRDEYTQTTTAKGTIQYRKNGKLVSKDEFDANTN